MADAKRNVAGPATKQCAEVRTAKAFRYLRQLLKHFSRKTGVRFDETSGEAAMPGGRVEMAAQDGVLRMVMGGESTSGLLQARYVVEDHLVRFAFREDPGPREWRRVDPSA